MQLGLQSLQLPRWVGIGTGDGAEVVTLRHPGLDRDEQRGRVGVAAGPWHPHVAGTQPGLHSIQHAEFPVVAVGGAAALAAGGFEVTAPASRHERCRGFGGRVARHCRASGPVQLAQYLDRVKERGDIGAGGVAGQRQVCDDGRGEGPQVLVAGSEQVEMPVITRLPLRHGPSGGPQPRHPDARTDQPAGVSVGDGWVGEDVEHLIEEPAAVDLHLGSFHDALGQLVPGAGVSTSQRLIQELYEFVQDLDVGFSERGQQDRIPAVDIGALQRLIGERRPVSASIRCRPAGSVERSSPSAP